MTDGELLSQLEVLELTQQFAPRRVSNNDTIADRCLCDDCTQYRASKYTPRITRQGANLIGLDELLGEAAPYFFCIIESGSIASSDSDSDF